MNLMKNDENEPYPILFVFEKVMVIFIIYLSTTKTKPDWLPKTIVVDVIVLYVLCMQLYYFLIS
jgi:hypothetical protein